MRDPSRVARHAENRQQSSTQNHSSPLKLALLFIFALHLVSFGQDRLVVVSGDGEHFLVKPDPRRPTARQSSNLMPAYNEPQTPPPRELARQKLITATTNRLAAIETSRRAAWAEAATNKLRLDAQLAAGDIDAETHGQRLAAETARLQQWVAAHQPELTRLHLQLADLSRRPSPAPPRKNRP